NILNPADHLGVVGIHAAAGRYQHLGLRRVGKGEAGNHLHAHRRGEHAGVLSHGVDIEAALAKHLVRPGVVDDLHAFEDQDGYLRTIVRTGGHSPCDAATRLNVDEAARLSLESFNAILGSAEVDASLDDSVQFLRAGHAVRHHALAVEL